MFISQHFPKQNNCHRSTGNLKTPRPNTVFVGMRQPQPVSRTLPCPAPVRAAKALFLQLPSRRAPRPNQGKEQRFVPNTATRIISFPERSWSSRGAAPRSSHATALPRSGSAPGGMPRERRAGSAPFLPWPTWDAASDHHHVVSLGHGAVPSVPAVAVSSPAAAAAPSRPRAPTAPSRPPRPRPWAWPHGPSTNGRRRGGAYPGHALYDARCASRRGRGCSGQPGAAGASRTPGTPGAPGMPYPGARIATGSVLGHAGTVPDAGCSAWSSQLSLNPVPLPPGEEEIHGARGYGSLPASPTRTKPYLIHEPGNKGLTSPRTCLPKDSAWNNKWLSKFCLYLAAVTALEYMIVVIFLAMRFTARTGFIASV